MIPNIINKVPKFSMSLCNTCTRLGTLIANDGILKTFGCIKCGNTWQEDINGKRIS